MGVLRVEVLPPLSMRLRLADGPRAAEFTEEIRPGDTVLTALRRLAERYPVMMGTVIDKRLEAVEPGVIVVVDGLRVTGERSLGRRLGDDATMLVTAAVAGG